MNCQKKECGEYDEQQSFNCYQHENMDDCPDYNIDIPTEPASSVPLDGIVGLPVRLFAGMLTAITMRYDGEAQERILKDVSPYINENVKKVFAELKEVLDELVG